MPVCMEGDPIPTPLLKQPTCCINTLRTFLDPESSGSEPRLRVLDPGGSGGLGSTSSAQEENLEHPRILGQTVFSKRVLAVPYYKKTREHISFVSYCVCSFFNGEDAVQSICLVLFWDSLCLGKRFESHMSCHATL